MLRHGLRVKSGIASPVDGAAAEVSKPVTIRGVAWSGDKGPVTAVDVSMDGGRNWSAARLDGIETRFGWRQWQFTWAPQGEGYYNLMSRARDKSGDVQPLIQEWNPSGYLWNVVPHVGLNVVGKAGLPPNPAPPTPVAAAAPPDRFRAVCLTCHDEDMIRQQRITRTQWSREIDKMMRWGAPAKPEDREAILDYLNNYGPRPR